MFFPDPKREWIGSLVLMGAAFCASAFPITFILDWRFVKEASRAHARITKVVESEDRDGNSKSFYPVFVFSDAAGIEHSVQSEMGTNPSDYHVGDETEILYIAKTPERAEINRLMYLWAWPIVTGALALILGSVGTTLMLWPNIVGRFRRQAQT
jgi:hypothetical protein